MNARVLHRPFTLHPTGSTSVSLVRDLGRHWPAIAVWTVTVALSVLTVVRVLGADRGVLLVQAVSFTPYLAVGALIPVTVALTRRQWWAAGVAGLAAAALLSLVVPRAFGVPAETGGTPVTVMSVNMMLGRADAPSIVDVVRSRSVDVLAVQEVSPQAETELDRVGLAELLPYRESHPEWGASGSALYSRFPLTDGGGRVASPEGHGQAYAMVHPPGVEPVRVESVHPVPPLDPDNTGRWAAGLRAQLPAGEHGPILAGDFNATLDHTELRRLLDTGYRDAASEVGDALAPTWPFYGPRAWLTPRVTIDHVLVPRQIAVHAFTVVPIPDTDHRAIVATLLLP
jgi:endonuclease/exonuclease/phosphatase family metal-dependent hydrolase